MKLAQRKVGSVTAGLVYTLTLSRVLTSLHFTFSKRVISGCLYMILPPDLKVGFDVEWVINACR